MLDDAETFASEVPDSELVCMAGTANPERLNRIFAGQDEPTQEEWTVILGCLQTKPSSGCSWARSSKSQGL